jgi:hypothetical protein
VTKVGKAWETYLADAAKLRAAHARAIDTEATAESRYAAAAERAGIYRAMSNRYGGLIGMLDEINGTRVISEAAGSPRGLVLYHGGLRQGATLDDIDLGRIGTQQGKGGKYGGFYLTDESSKSWSEGYAAQRNAGLHAFRLREDAQILDKGDEVIDRLTPARLGIYLDDGYDVVKGKDSLGRTQYVLLNKDAVDEMLPADQVGRAERVDGVLGNRLTGGHLVTFPTNKTPITELSDLTSYLSSTDGLLRLAGGAPAREVVVMPGRLSLWAEQRAIEDTSAARKTRSRAMIFDYTNAMKMLPDESEAGILDSAAAAMGDLQLQEISQSAFRSARAARLKWDRISRRLTTTIPNVTRIDLNDGGSTKLVEQLGRIYLNKGDAARLASAYNLGNVAQRRQILKGAIMQTFHASGLSRSEDGRLFMQKFLGDYDDFARQRYGLGDTSKIVVDGQEKQAALLESQISTNVIIPSMREMHFLATKFAVAGWGRRVGVNSIRAFGQSDAADYMLGAIKIGWITTIAGGLRNALDEVANIAAYGMGRDALKARAVYTRATEGLRAKRRELSKKYLDDVRAAGGSRDAVDERYRQTIGQANVNHEEAVRALDAARKGQLDLDNAEGLFDARTQAIRDRAAKAQDAVRTARMKIEAMRGNEDDVLAREQLAEELRRALDEQDKAEQASRARAMEERPAPGEQTAKVREQLDRRGTLSVPDAEAQLKRAEKERKDARALEGIIRHRVPLWVRGAADTVNDLMIGVALGKLVRVFGRKYAITEQDVNFAKELADRELAQVASDGLFQAHYWDSGMDDRYAMALHRAGLKARRYAYEKRYEGWGEIEPDAGAGLDSWAKMMGLAFEDSASPAHAWVETVRTMRRTGREFQQTALPGDVLDRIRGGAYPGVSEETRQELLDAYARVDDPLGDEFIDEAGQAWSRNTAMELEAAQQKAMTELLEAELAAGKTLRYLPDQGARTDAVSGEVMIRNEKDLSDLLDDIVDWPGKDEADTPFMHLLNPERWVISEPVDLTGQVDRLALESARDAIRARMGDEDMRHFVSTGEVFQQLRDGTKVGTNPLLRDQVLDEYADRLTAHLTMMLTGRNGRVSDELIDMLADSKLTGAVPDSSWLAGIPAEYRPEKVIGQLWAPYNPEHLPDTFPRGYTQMMAVAYDKVVTDQINALSRNPLVTALYINARRNTMAYRDKLVAAGWSEENADIVVRRIALRHAEEEAFKHIDNPYVSSQFSLVYRNYATFVRAQEDWLRRWGRTIKDNPQVIRQAQLLIHATQAAGHVEVNEDGDLVFVYPGSALMGEVFAKAFGAENNPLRAAVTSELSSKVAYMNPSLDNPVGLTATPLLSIPLGMLTSRLGPDHQVLQASLDKAINGELGAGRTAYEKLLPSWASRILAAAIPNDDPGSAYGQAYAETLANAEAAGLLDDPYYQSQTGQAALNHAIQVGVRNALVWKALFGIFAPAAPQLEMGIEGHLPHDDSQPYGSGTRPDWVYHEIGLGSLKDEARRLIDEVGFEQARVDWTATHPNELIYFDSARTEINTPSASASATLAAANYIEGNQPFFDKYGGEGGVAAYFIPQGKSGTKDGEFSDVAYQAQLESGIRDYKSLSDYFVDVITSRGARDYYAAKDAYDVAHGRAVQSGNQTQASALEEEWAKQKEQILRDNPLLQKRFVDYAVNNAGKELALAQVRELAADTSPEITGALGANRQGLLQLLDAWSTYQQGVARLGERRSRAATREREALKQTYAAAVERIAGSTSSQYPELADLARGVFRLPE